MPDSDLLLLAVREVWEEPTRRVHLDWYDGPVQSVLMHPEHGAWYVFAVAIGAAGERLYAVRQLADPSIADELADVETLDDPDWLVRLGQEVLLPACTDSGVWVSARDQGIQEIRVMSAEEQERTVPRGLHALLHDT